MCGRYTVNTEEEVIEMREILGQISERMLIPDGYDGWEKDAFPKSEAPVLTGRGIILARWGFPKPRGEKGVVFNARNETVKTNAFFRAGFEKLRCVVPARAYYEWRKNGTESTRYIISSHDGAPLFMKGFMREDENGGLEFVIVTKPARESLLFIHPRMPALICKKDIRQWLSGNDTDENESNTGVVFRSA